MTNTIHTDYIGTKIYTLRHHRGWTQADLAVRSGCSSEDISNYERGVCYPTLPKVARLAQVLDTTSDYLIGLTNHQERQSYTRSKPFELRFKQED